MSDEQIGKMLAAADSMSSTQSTATTPMPSPPRFGTMELKLHHWAFFRAAPEIEKHLAERYKATDVRDFVEPIDEIHISRDHGWFVAHWSATNAKESGGERRPVKGYITAVLEKRNGEWKARMHTTFPSAAQ
jgi:ketosteroid isomerase-like protein